MDKLIFVICLLAALSSIPSGPNKARMDWEVALHASRRCVTDLRIDFSGPCEWQITLRWRILTLDYEAREGLSHWRSRRA
jgi:hypothetical protein